MNWAWPEYKTEQATLVCLKLSIEDYPLRINTLINIDEQQAHLKAELETPFLFPWPYYLDIFPSIDEYKIMDQPV